MPSCVQSIIKSVLIMRNLGKFQTVNKNIFLAHKITSALVGAGKSNLGNYDGATNGRTEGPWDREVSFPIITGKYRIQQISLTL